MLTHSPSEKQIEKSILEYLTLKKIFVWKQNTIGVFDSKRNIYRLSHSPFVITGISDILGMFRGTFLAIEVKTPTRKNNLTDNQKKFIDRVNENGGIAFVATSIDDVKKTLNI